MATSLSKEVQEAMWGDAALLKILEQLEQRFKAGDKAVVWEAIDFCGHVQFVLPDWLRDAVSNITHGLRSGELGSFDEAFDTKLESKATRKRKQALRMNRPRILQALMEHRLAGGSFNSVDFDEIAEKLNVPRNHVEEVRKENQFLGPLRGNPGRAIHAIASTSSPMPKRYGRPIAKDSDD